MTATFAQGMRSIPQAEWDALAGRYGNPFLSWSFLALLEDSLSICPETGWTPNHLLIRDSGRLLAAAPFYGKTHSMGEFVFDFEFARVAETIGAAWYPKLIGMVPATPAPLWRVLVGQGGDENSLTTLALSIAGEAARKAGLGGIHLLWPAPDFVDTLSKLPDVGLAYSEWKHSTFIWTDEGYGNFEAYLQSFSKNMRRNIKRERTSVAEAGIETRIITPAEAKADPRLMETMADYYEDTNARFGPWSAKFLTRDFFRLLPEYLEAGWFMTAGYFRDDTNTDHLPHALALLFESGDSLYGRYWGTRGKIDGLHFELCYYLPIEYALAHGIKRFDPGMGSEHKARRGFRSVLAPSFHQSFDRRMTTILKKYLPIAGAQEADYARSLNGDLPFKLG